MIVLRPQPYMQPFHQLSHFPPLLPIGGGDTATRGNVLNLGPPSHHHASLQVCGDATILFPLLVSQTFAKRYWEQRRKDGAQHKQQQQPQHHKAAAH